MKAVIFDMDGVLVDSEPLWWRAEQAVFAEVGIELTDAMCEETVGMRTRDVVAYWYARFPWTGRSQSSVADAIIAAVADLIEAEGRALPGAVAALERTRSAGYRVGLASSSPTALIEAVLEKLAIRAYFEALASGSDEARGKPHPAVYLTAARRLGTDPARCIAIEDSIAGVQSAKAAGMRVVAVPSASQFDDPGFGAADFRLRSLADLSLDQLR